jgi:hypothetical protein
VTVPRPPLLLLVVVLVLAGCTRGGSEQGTAEVPEGWQQHTFDGHTIATPQDWQETDPILDDTLTVRGPDGDGGAPIMLRVKVGDDAVPADTLLQLFAGSLALQVAGYEALDAERREVDGAQYAEVGDFRYEGTVDGSRASIRERVLVARAEGGGDVQLRFGSLDEDFDAATELFEDIIDTLQLRR